VTISQAWYRPPRLFAAALVLLIGLPVLVLGGGWVVAPHALMLPTEDRTAIEDVERLARLQLPPSTRQLHTYDERTWDGGTLLVRFEMDRQELPLFLQQAALHDRQGNLRVLDLEAGYNALSEAKGNGLTPDWHLAWWNPDQAADPASAIDQWSGLFRYFVVDQSAPDTLTVYVGIFRF
jgi:hypothetical protein